MAATSNSQTSNASANHVDNSLYSPSSSTSLLYHIYDQINLPNEHQQAYSSSSNNSNNNSHHQQQARTNNKQANATTILNPADLFGVITSQQPQVIPQPQIATSTTLQLHQQQQQQAAEFLHRQKILQQQLLYSTGNQYHLQPPPAFSTLHHNSNSNHNHNSSSLHHLNNNNNNNNNNNGASNGNANATYLGSAAANQEALDATERMVLDSMIHASATLHQQQLANTLARKHHLNNQQHLTYHARPISSSGASSMSGQSMAVAYGRQPRPASSSKSQANLSSVLQSNQTLDYLGLGSNVAGGLTATSCSSGPKKLAHFSSSSSSNPATNFMSCKRAKQRVRKIAYEYSTVLKCFGLLVLLAFGLMSIIKLALVNQQQQAAGINTNSNQANSILPIAANNNNNNAAANSNSPLVYPFKYPDQAGHQLANGADPTDPSLLLASSDASQQQQQASSDDLRSKLLIGEFVITSQNYSHSAAHRSLLAENLVKLMDQVFLSSPAVRHFYSRLEVTNVRPNKTGGLVVDCNIILSESIAYAAQQFGIALYESLTKTNEKLANQPSFIIDKNSIRFNTVPDKDLRAGLVPPGLISASVSRELLAPSALGQPPHLSADLGAPSSGPPGQQQQQQQLDSSMLAPSSIGEPLANPVVWSEWSQWSSCVDKNGVCDPSRLHSRLRKCVAQHTGEKVEASQCKQRFNVQDQELEVADCSLACQGQASAASPTSGGSLDSHVLMSDEPIGPQTAPSVLVGGNDPAVFLLPPPPQLKFVKQQAGHGKQQQQQQQVQAAQQQQQQQTDLNSISMAASTRSILLPSELVDQDPRQQPLGPSSASSSTVASTVAGNSVLAATDKTLAGEQQQPAAPINLEQQQQQQMSCSNCTSDEICLLMVQQKVPFCAKIKDRLDESGCGGWCKAQPGQLCQPVGQNAFKCILDSECLANEWRCHDSACIPLEKRCDGHYNCYDNSDERDCPMKS